MGSKPLVHVSEIESWGPEVQNFAWLCPHEKKAWWKAGAAASKCFGSLGFWPRCHHHYIRNTHLRRRKHLYLDALFRDGDGDGGEGEEEEGPDQGEDDEEVEPAAEEKSSDTLVVKSWPESKAELQFSNKKGLVLKSHGRRKSLKLKDHVLVEIEGGQVQLTAAPGECDLQWKLIKATKLLFVSDEGRKCLKVSDILKQKNVQTVYGHALASGNKIGPLKDGKQAARPCLGNRELGT